MDDTLKTRISEAINEVDDISLKLRGEEGKKARQAVYLLMAVGELVQKAWELHGGKGDAEPMVIRMKDERKLAA
jgi:hypothetical protein